VVRELRKGFATALAWDEAIEISGHDLQSNTSTYFGAQTEKYIEVIFPNVDPESVETLITTLKSAQYITNPTIQGVVRSGTYELIHLKPEKQEDGCIWLRVFMGTPQYSFRCFEKIGTPDETEVYYLWNVPKRLAQDLVDSYETGTGTSAIANYSTAQGLVDITVRTRGTVILITISNIKTEDGCLTYEYQDFYWGLTLAQAQALDIGVAPQGWIYRLDGISYDGQASYSARVTRIQARARTVLDGVDIEDSEESTVNRTKKINQTALPAALSAAAGERQYLREVELNRFCLFDYAVDTETVHSQTGTGWEKKAEFNDVRAYGRHGSAVSEPGTPAAGVEVEVENQPDGYGKYNTTTRTRTFAALTGTGWERLAEYDDVRTSSKHGSTVADPGDQAAGTVVDVDNEPDGYGKYNSRTRTRTFKQLTGTGWEKTKEYTEVRASGRHASAVAEPTWADPTDVGTIKEVDNRPDGYGKYDTQTRTRTFTELAGQLWHKNKFYAQTTTLAEHAAAASEPSQADGKIRETTNRPDGYGKYSTSVMERTTTDNTQTPTPGNEWATSTYLRLMGNKAIYGTRYHGAATKPTKTFAESGYGELDVHLEEDGRWYGMKTTEVWSDGYDPATINSWTTYTSDAVTVSEFQFCSIGGLRKKRTLTITYTVKHTRSGISAYAHISSGGPGSRVDMFTNSTGPYGYRAMKVTGISWTVWADDSASGSWPT
jgi:hypothetical protein